MRRIYHECIDRFKKEKMTFISGPRQVGKTTLTKGFLSSSDLYLNWDIPDHKQEIQNILQRSGAKNLKANILILDEIHKLYRWKSALKGLYDRKLEHLRIFVTGSARLDTFQKSGDSLLGRYELLRIHPFSIGELTHGSLIPPPVNWSEVGTEVNQGTIEKLLEFGGFPEPYLENDSLFYNRWAVRRRDLLIKEDLRELSDIKLISAVEELAMILPSKVGSLLSLNSLKEDLSVSHESIQLWLETLERLYYIYRIKPYSKSVSKGLTKIQKMYLWDWGQAFDQGSKWENLVAGHLLKSVHLWNDLGYGEFELNYLRTKDHHEIDFLITNKRKPIVAIEVKSTDESLSPSWFKFADILKNIPKIQVIQTSGIDRMSPHGIRVVSVDKFLAGLN